MIRLTIISGRKTEFIETGPGLSLLTILRKYGFTIYAPCGGKGTCGKCLADIKGLGTVVSCTYFPSSDVEVVLPDKEESIILTSQTDFLEDFPLNIDIPGHLSKRPYGVAVDIGTTTVVLYFLDMLTGKIEKISTFLNPQKIYGADVITRIEYCQRHKDGLTELQNILIKEINKALDDFTSQVKCEPGDISKIIFTGNTTMLHILLGEDPVSIAMAPFIPKFTGMQIRTGKETGLNINDSAGVVTLPCISAYVGADIVSGLSALKSGKSNYIYLDIGTNGEMALVKGNDIYTCSTAAGPAFEGARISCGMGAVSGAISSFNGLNNYLVVGNAEPLGICGSGIIDIVAFLLAQDLIDETGILEESFIIDEKNNIQITQQDIREIQLAKSAIYSGIIVLLEHAGISFNDVDALFLAGGFGNYIKVESALKIGLLPEELRNKIHAVGNSAGIGALQFLKSSEFEIRIDGIVQQSKYIELSHSDEFTIQFALNMYFQK